jgi:L-2-hydroxycarboxylate dehydrogenase (NAD+)
VRSCDVDTPTEPLRAFLIRLFARAGLDQLDARFCAGCLVGASLWGKDSHGVMRTEHYIRRLQSGAVNPKPHIVTVRGRRAIETLDGDNGLGFLVGRAAMDRAVALAREHGVGVVGVRRSSHFGAAGLYARLAADEGMAGIAMTNAAAKIVAPGGARPITGSNPMAVAVPSYGEFPFVLDVSTSALSGGKLLVAAQQGERIEPGAAMSADGQPTEDPLEAFKGLWAPMGGVKGLGLSYTIDVLSGVITGASFGLAMKSQYTDASEPSGTGHFMIAVNLDDIISRDELRGRMTQYMSSIRESPMKDTTARMLVPGERAYLTEQTRLANGIPLPPQVLSGLHALGRELGVPSAGLPPNRADWGPPMGDSADSAP